MGIMAESRRGERKKGAEQGKMYSVIKTKKNSDSRDARCTSGLLIAPFDSLFSSPFFFFCFNSFCCPSLPHCNFCHSRVKKLAMSTYYLNSIEPHIYLK